MFRFLVSLFLGLLLIGLAGPIQALSPRPAAAHVAVTGMLEWREGPGIHHYAVSGYVLIAGNSLDLKPLVGTQVTVQGTEVTGPTSFMQRALLVDRITAEPPISTPVVPDPSVSLPPHSGNRISIPEHPPLVGTDHLLLFGEVLRTDDQFYVRDLLDKASTAAIIGGEIRLEELEGEIAGLVASPGPTLNGTRLYRVLHAVVLTRDLADVVRARESLIYLPPHGEISIRLRGKELRLDQSPIVGNGRTLLNLRAIAEGLGAEIAWDQQTRTATVRLDGREVVVRVGSNRIILRAPGEPDRVLTVDIAPVIAGGRTMVPARVVSEGLGLAVSWDPDSRTVVVN